MERVPRPLNRSRDRLIRDYRLVLRNNVFANGVPTELQFDALCEMDHRCQQASRGRQEVGSLAS